MSALRVFSVYELATGRFTGLRIGSNDSELIAANTPNGHGVKQGEYHPERHAVDLTTGEVVEGNFTPPAVVAERAIDSAQAEIIALERATLRSLRELLVSQAGDEVLEAAFARLCVVDARIVALRARRKAIAAAQTPEEIAAAIAAGGAP